MGSAEAGEAVNDDKAAAAAHTPAAATVFDTMERVVMTRMLARRCGDAQVIGEEQPVQSIETLGSSS